MLNKRSFFSNFGFDWIKKNWGGFWHSGSAPESARSPRKPSKTLPKRPQSEDARNPSLRRLESLDMESYKTPRAPNPYTNRPECLRAKCTKMKQQKRATRRKILERTFDIPKEIPLFRKKQQDNATNKATPSWTPSCRKKQQDGASNKAAPSWTSSFRK